MKINYFSLKNYCARILNDYAFAHIILLFSHRIKLLYLFEFVARCYFKFQLNFVLKE